MLSLAALSALCVFVCTLCWVPPSRSASSGGLAYCDLGSNFAYGLGSTVMPWATAPVASDLFSIRSADGDPANDPTSYRSNVPVPIHIRALNPAKRFLGLVLYAIKGNFPRSYTPKPSDVAFQVGEWDVPAGAEFQQWVPTTPGSGKCVTHTSGSYKPLWNVFWVTLPEGTGTVTFRALIKYGEQNSGAFVWPKDVLVLTEGVNGNDLKSPNVVQSRKFESCTAACARAFPTTTKYCNSVATRSLNSTTELRERFVATTCRPPYLVSASETCNQNIPFQEVNGPFCVLDSRACNMQAQLNTPSTSTAVTQPATPQEICDSRSFNAERFCACTAKAPLVVAAGTQAGLGHLPHTESAQPPSSATMSATAWIALAVVSVAVVAAVLSYVVVVRSRSALRQEASAASKGSDLQFVTLSPQDDSAPARPVAVGRSSVFAHVPLLPSSRAAPHSDSLRTPLNQ